MEPAQQVALFDTLRQMVGGVAGAHTQFNDPAYGGGSGNLPGGYPRDQLQPTSEQLAQHSGGYIHHGMSGNASAQSNAVAGTINSLTRLQIGDASTLRQDSPAPQSGSGFLNELKGGGVMGSLAAPEAMTVDIVAMLFDYLLDDKDVPDSMRALIARLQIPIVKVALLDQEFFFKKSHPARRLLNGIAEASLLWGNDAGEDSKLSDLVEVIVQRILDDFDDDISLFDELAGVFGRFLAERAEREALKAAQAARIEEGKRRLERAKVWAREQIDARLNNGLHNDTVANFLTNHWKRLLIDVYAEADEEAEELNEAVRTMDDLVWGVSEVAIATEPLKVGQMVPDIVECICNGLDVISVPAFARDSLLKKFDKIHAELPSMPGGAEDSLFDMTGGAVLGDTTDAALLEEPVPLEELEPDAFFDDDLTLDAAAAMNSGRNDQPVAEETLPERLSDTVPNPAQAAEIGMDCDGTIDESTNIGSATGVDDETQAKDLPIDLKGAVEQKLARDGEVKLDELLLASGSGADGLPPEGLLEGGSETKEALQRLFQDELGGGAKSSSSCSSKERWRSRK